MPTRSGSWRAIVYSASWRTRSTSPRAAKYWNVPTRMWLAATRVSTAPGSTRLAKHRLAGGHDRERPRGRDAEGVHAFADQHLAQHRPDRRLAVAAARERRPARSPSRRCRGAGRRDRSPRRAAPPGRRRAAARSRRTGGRRTPGRSARRLRARCCRRRGRRRLRRQPARGAGAASRAGAARATDGSPAAREFERRARLRRPAAASTGTLGQGQLRPPHQARPPRPLAREVRGAVAGASCDAVRRGEAEQHDTRDRRRAGPEGPGCRKLLERALARAAGGRATHRPAAPCRTTRPADAPHGGAREPRQGFAGALAIAAASSSTAFSTVR